MAEMPGKIFSLVEKMTMVGEMSSSVSGLLLPFSLKAINE